MKQERQTVSEVLQTSMYRGEIPGEPRRGTRFRTGVAIVELPSKA
jgi:hypothetical protein